jgi:dihydroxy-acid dehydratase
VGHVAPEAQEGGPIALIRNGDVITIDSTKKLISVDVSDEELAARKETWSAPETMYPRGALAKFAKLTSSASLGAVTS